LNNSPTALLSQVRNGRADELDGAGKIGPNLMIELRIRDLLGRAEQPIACIAYQQIDPAQLAERIRQNRADAGRVREVEYRHHQATAVQPLEVGEAVLTPRGGDNAIATRGGVRS
jgi:hypothetical protein